MLNPASDPEALLSPLLQVGQEPDDALFDRIAAGGEAVVPGLIAMAADRTLEEGDADEDPRVWAPLHAVRLLGRLRAAEAVEPLLALLDLDDDWMAEALPAALGSIGRPALAPLAAYLLDPTHGEFARLRAAESLAAIARQHPDLRTEAIAALVEGLAPERTLRPADETINGHIVSTLTDLQATEATAAIVQAFAEDRVDRFVIDADDVEQAWGVEFNLPPEVRTPPRLRGEGMRLWLRCTACGFTRLYNVGKVYCDLPTLRAEEQGGETARSPYVISRHITCAHCGAVDQYEISPQGYMQLMAEMLAARAAQEAGGRRERPAGLEFISFRLLDGRQMHPYDALEMYRAQVAAEPRRSDLRLRLGNVLRSIGRVEEAAEQYRLAVELDPANVEACMGLAVLAHEDGDTAEARRLYRRVLDLAPHSKLPRRDRDLLAQSAREAIAEIEQTADLGPLGQINVHALSNSPSLPPLPAPRSLTIPSPAATSAPQAVKKVGRNDPCPCGSGKKYKKCHGA